MKKEAFLPLYDLAGMKDLREVRAVKADFIEQHKAIFDRLEELKSLERVLYKKVCKFLMKAHTITCRNCSQSLEFYLDGQKIEGLTPEEMEGEDLKTFAMVSSMSLVPECDNCKGFRKS